MKRFWTDAREAEAAEGFSILLDGRPVHLPGGATLVVPFPGLARALAEEWQAAGGAVGGEMSFDDTPLTRLAGTAQERILPDPAPTAEAIARYGESELLCYRASGPAPLVERQAREWQPWLDWAARTHDARLTVTSGIMAVHQDGQALAALRRAVFRLDGWMLAGLGLAVPSLGSLVLGLALAAGALGAARAHELSLLDELFQTELWGHDPEADARRCKIGQDIAVAARFMELARS